MVDPRTVANEADEPHGNRTRITHPDGKYFEYAYEATDHLLFVSENGPSVALVSNLYDDFGRRYRIDRDTAGSVTAILFDEISRLKSIGHNLDGNATTTNDLGIGFSYNAASQVIARSQTNGLYDYPIPAVNQTYTRNGLNQYPAISGTGGGSPLYDLNGNLTSDGKATPTNYVYDAENRLVSASGAKSATFTYDPLGRLFQGTTTGSTRFLYDGDRLIVEYDGNGVLKRRYVHGAGVDEPLVWYEGSGVSATTRRYLHADHQGSIVATANAAGAKLEIGTYDAYGVSTAPSSWRFQYTGQTFISSIGLYYYKARFYNPGLGRFMQTDPIGYDDDVNLYAYVGNDPMNNSDPSGNVTSSTCSRVGAASCPGVFSTTASGRPAGGKETPKPASSTRLAVGVLALSEIPGVSTVAGLLDGLMSLADGDYFGAALSAAGLIPAVGTPADALKVERSASAVLGRNARAAGSRTATDLPGDRATAKSIFRNQSRGQEVTQTTMQNGGVRRTTPDNTQIRMNPDGTTRVDLPNRGPRPNGETIHIPPEN